MNKDASSNTESLDLTVLPISNNSVQQGTKTNSPKVALPEEASRRAEQAASLLSRLSSALESKHLCFGAADFKAFGSVSTFSTIPPSINGASKSLAPASLSASPSQQREHNLQSRNPLRTSTSSATTNAPRPYPAPSDPRRKALDLSLSSSLNKRPAELEVHNEAHSINDGPSPSPVPLSTHPSTTAAKRPSLMDIVPDYLKKRKRSVPSVTVKETSSDSSSSSENEMRSPMHQDGITDKISRQKSKLVHLDQQQADCQEPPEKRRKVLETNGMASMDATAGMDILMSDITGMPSTDASALQDSKSTPVSANDATEPFSPHLEHLFDDSLSAPIESAPLPARPVAMTMLERASASLPWKSVPTPSASASAIKSMFPVKRTAPLPPRPIPSLLDNKILSSDGPVAISARSIPSIDKTRAAAASAHVRASAEAATNGISAAVIQTAPTNISATRSNQAASPVRKGPLSPMGDFNLPRRPANNAAALPDVSEIGTAEAPSPINHLGKASSGAMETSKGKAIIVNATNDTEQLGRTREEDLRKRLKRQQMAATSLPTTSNEVPASVSYDHAGMQLDTQRILSTSSQGDPRQSIDAEKIKSAGTLPLSSGVNRPSIAPRVSLPQRMIPVVEIYNRRSTSVRPIKSAAPKNMSINASLSRTSGDPSFPSVPSSKIKIPSNALNPDAITPTSSDRPKALAGSTASPPSTQHNTIFSATGILIPSSQLDSSQIIEISDNSSSSDEDDVTLANLDQTKNTQSIPETLATMAEKPKDTDVASQPNLEGPLSQIADEAKKASAVQIASDETVKKDSVQSEAGPGTAQLRKRDEMDSSLNARGPEESMIARLASKGHPYIYIYKSDLAELEARGIKILESYIRGHLIRQKPLEVHKTALQSKKVQS